MDTETKKIINSLTKRLTDLESKYKQHQHTGLDSRKVYFKNLDTIIYTEVMIDPGSLADGAGETQSVTIEGVNLGDFVLVSASYDLQDIIITGYVQAQDTVEIRIQNESGGVIDLASGTWRVIVIKKFIE